jgi:hypothetical protein
MINLIVQDGGAAVRSHYSPLATLEVFPLPEENK